MCNLCFQLLSYVDRFDNDTCPPLSVLLYLQAVETTLSFIAFLHIAMERQTLYAVNIAPAQGNKAPCITCDRT